jgi:hypothetical protein
MSLEGVGVLTTVRNPCPFVKGGSPKNHGESVEIVQVGTIVVRQEEEGCASARSLQERLMMYAPRNSDSRESRAFSEREKGSHLKRK